MIYVIGISLAVFLEFLLLIKKNKSKADKILVVWLAIIALHQFLHYFQFSGEVFNYPFLLGVEFPLPVLHGIILFYYVSEITNQKLKSYQKYLIFIPVALILALSFNFYLLSTEEKLYIFKNNGEGFEKQALMYSIIIVVSGLLYTILSYAKIEKHKKNVEQIFSNTHKIDLLWLKLLNLGLGAIWILVVLFQGQIVFIGMAAFVLMIGFFGINQTSIFTSNQNNENLNDSDQQKNLKQDKQPAIKRRYIKSGLSEANADKIYEDLQLLMKDKGVYKNENITLSELANMLDVHSNHLSQVINEREKKNFYYYINSLRVNEFIKIASLPENKKYTILHLAYECGFNSKSTFNKHFKEATSKTPSEYFRA